VPVLLAFPEPRAVGRVSFVEQAALGPRGPPVAKLLMEIVGRGGSWVVTGQGTFSVGVAASGGGGLGTFWPRLWG
jgi:hypothetical protein